MSTRPLSRRFLLRGFGGAFVGLPLLDAMLDSRGRIHGAASAQAMGPPTRMGVIFLPNGVSPPNWTPATEGAGYAVTPILQPIGPYVDHFNVLTGLQLGIPSSDDPHNVGTA